MATAPDRRPATTAVADRAPTRFDVAAVIVTYNSAGDIEPLLHDLRAEQSSVRRLRLIVVDNASSDGTPDVVRGFDDVVLLETGANLGYSAAINRGAALLEPGELLLVLNPDLRIEPGCVARLVAAADDGVGIVTPKMTSPDGGLQPTLHRLPTVRRALADGLFGARRAARWRPEASEHILDEREYDHRRDDVVWATGAALLITAECHDKVGAWEESYFLYAEEVDFQLRAREAGFVVRYLPDAVVMHRLGESGSSPYLGTILALNRVRCFRRFHRLPTSIGYYLATVLNSVTRLGQPLHRRALVALVWPPARPEPVRGHRLLARWPR
jgi:GT2 family glycosyltransferase